MFDLILDSVEDFHTVEVRRLHRIFCGLLEIKNIATVPPFQRKGYAKALIEFLVEKYRRQFSILQVGTGDSPLTIPFYEKCGFVRSHTVPNFFTDHYDHPIYECGVHLVDMVYLQRPL